MENYRWSVFKDILNNLKEFFYTCYPACHFSIANALLKNTENTLTNKQQMCDMVLSLIHLINFRFNNCNIWYTSNLTRLALMKLNDFQFEIFQTQLWKWCCKIDTVCMEPCIRLLKIESVYHMTDFLKHIGLIQKENENVYQYCGYSTHKKQTCTNNRVFFSMINKKNTNQPIFPYIFCHVHVPHVSHFFSVSQTN